MAEKNPYAVEKPCPMLANPQGYWEKSVAEHYQEQKEKYLNSRNIAK